MKATSSLLILLFFSYYTICAQTKKSLTNVDSLAALKNRKAYIDQYEFKHHKQLAFFAKIVGKKTLIKIKEDNIPDNAEYVYTIVKDSTGSVLAIEQAPYSESGDWYEEFKNYFDSDGKTFAFTVKTTVFDDSVKGGIAMWQNFNYYNKSFVLLSNTSLLTGIKRPLKGRKKAEFDFRNDPYNIYKTVNACLKAYNIDRSKL